MTDDRRSAATLSEHRYSVDAALAGPSADALLASSLQSTSGPLLLPPAVLRGCNDGCHGGAPMAGPSDDPLITFVEHEPSPIPACRRGEASTTGGGGGSGRDALTSPGMSGQTPPALMSASSRSASGLTSPRSSLTSPKSPKRVKFGCTRTVAIPAREAAAAPQQPAPSART